MSLKDERTDRGSKPQPAQQNHVTLTDVIMLGMLVVTVLSAAVVVVLLFGNI